MGEQRQTGVGLIIKPEKCFSCLEMDVMKIEFRIQKSFKLDYCYSLTNRCVNT